MGCDIHFYVEKHYGKAWHAVQSPKSIMSSWDKRKRQYDWFVSRSYLLFGILAGVRVDNFITPIDPRGMPDDASPIVNSKYAAWRGDAHTPSYIYLNELLDFTSIESEREVWMNVLDYKKFKNNDNNLLDTLFWEPYKSQVVSIDEMDRLVNLLAFSNDNREVDKYVNIKAKLPITAFISHFWQSHVFEMKKLDKDPAKVRCVFWFDN